MTHNSPSIASNARDITSRRRVFCNVSVTSFADPETFSASEFGLQTISEMDVVGGDGGNGVFYNGDKGLDGATAGTTLNNLKLVVWE